MELTIGVDVGGTKIAAGLVDVEGHIVDRVRVPTSLESADTIDDGIAHAVMSLYERRGDNTVHGVGVAAAGFVDERRTTMRFSANLPPWVDHPLGRALSRRVGMRVVVENDANAAAWGEFRYGGGREVNDMVLVTLGTGLGGGIVLDGRLLRGAFGIAGELGHVKLVPGGYPCGCGQHGCWEQYSSGRALVRNARELADSDPIAAKVLLEAAGGDIEQLDGSMVTEAAKAGDAASIGLLEQLGRWLGTGITGVASFLDPAVVVVGGGVAEAGELVTGPAREAFAAGLSGGAHRPNLEIRLARLGNDAGIIGAADLARHP